MTKEILIRLEKQLGNSDNVQKWLEQPNSSLDGLKPSELTSEQLERVVKAIETLQFG